MDPSNTPNCDDVDDLDGVRGAPIEARLSDGAHAPVHRRRRRELRHRPRDPDALQHAHAPQARRPDGASDHASAPIDGLLSVSRVISYDPIKADADMESVCGPIGIEGGPCDGVVTIPAE